MLSGYYEYWENAGQRMSFNVEESSFSRQSLSKLRTLTKQFCGSWITNAALCVYPCFYLAHLYMS